jgi:hypothetical protein
VPLTAVAVNTLPPRSIENACTSEGPDAKARTDSPRAVTVPRCVTAALPAQPERNENATK